MDNARLIKYLRLDQHYNDLYDRLTIKEWHKFYRK